LLPAAILILALCCPAYPQRPTAEKTLSAQDVEATIAHFRTTDLRLAVEQFQKQMPMPVTDLTVRSTILRNLPADLLQKAVNDPKLTADLRAELDPVLSLYGRTWAYELIVVKADTPYVMSDTGVVLVVSTGTILRVESDDELLGYAAHEVGHEFFARYSIATRYAFKTVVDSGREPALTEKLKEILAIIELQCDAFAAITIASLGYDPLESVRGLERTARDFPGFSTAGHPPNNVRRQVTAGVVPPASLRVGSRKSAALVRLQQEVRAHMPEASIPSVR
jgi:predicted Zn-dependent protease